MAVTIDGNLLWSHFRVILPPDKPYQRDFHAEMCCIIQALQARVPNLLAISAFGSRIQGTAAPDSVLDLAVLVAGYADATALFDLAGGLADIQQRGSVYGR